MVQFYVPTNPQPAPKGSQTMTSTPYYPQIVLVKPAAALVAYSPYTLSNTTVGDVPTATITGLNGRPDIFVGKAASTVINATSNFEPGDFYNATQGKNPTDPFAPGDTFAVVLQGYPLATLRASAAITEGVEVGCAASGQIVALPAAGVRRIGVTLSAQATVNGLVDVLIDVQPAQPVGTLASLGTAAAAGVGARATVTDASAAFASATVGTTITGGGANITPAFSDGVNWRFG